MNLYKLCLRFIFNKQFQDIALVYLFEENSKNAALKFQKMLKKDNEMATFFDEDFVGVEKTIDSFTMFIIKPDEEWSSQERILASFDYKTFEIIKGDESTTSFYFDGVYPDNY